MMKWMHWAVTATCAFAMTAGVAAAEAPTPKNRQIEQQKRIAQGVRSGELTKSETRGLERNAARIHRSIVRDRRDHGVFTARERRQAQHALNRQSRAIGGQKHDRQDR